MFNALKQSILKSENKEFERNALTGILSEAKEDDDLEAFILDGDDEDDDEVEAIMNRLDSISDNDITSESVFNEACNILESAPSVKKGKSFLLSEDNEEIIAKSFSFLD